MSDEILVAGKSLVAVGTDELSVFVLHDHMLGQAVLAARFISTLATEPLAYKGANGTYYFADTVTTWTMGDNNTAITRIRLRLRYTQDRSVPTIQYHDKKHVYLNNNKKIKK
jgi:hypothetical protein